MSESMQAETQRTLWNTAYAERGIEDVSWAQVHPDGSMAAIEAIDVPPRAAVIDVGGGASTFSQALADRGFTDLTVLDLSEMALEAARDAFRDASIDWVSADVLHWAPDRRYDVWHDRAVWHFFVEEADRQAYRDTLRSALAPGGAVIVETFAPDGPDSCSGLPVVRYDEDALAEALGDDLELEASGREDHRTPAGDVQKYVWVAMRRTD